jgi:GST-like protein
MCAWGPRREWFAAQTPKFVAVADAVYRHPKLEAVLRRNELI